MPGTPVTGSQPRTLSPIGCTKQLINVACRSVPAAELIRPAGTKPFCWAHRKRSAQIERKLSSASAEATAVATRWRTSSTETSLPLAYFSCSTSPEISWGGIVAVDWLSMGVLLDGNPELPETPIPPGKRFPGGG